MKKLFALSFLLMALQGWCLMPSIPDLQLNPIPQTMEFTEGAPLKIGDGFALKGDFREKIDYLPIGKSVPLTVKINKALSAEQYTLSINANGVEIFGGSPRAEFYGLQTLRQLVENQGTELALMEILDQPVFPLRGVVEGYYGAPWPMPVKEEIIEQMGQNKMNVYVYGPKDDPYHRSPHWRDPYPQAEAQQLKKLAEICKKAYVDFVWAIHPGEDIKWDTDDDYHYMVKKMESLYDLGVRGFAVFFDDISGDGANPHKQVEILNRLNREFIKKKKDLAPLILCPTDYNRSWANPTENGSLAIFGRELDKDIEIFWTGRRVMSDIDLDATNWAQVRIQRPPLIWWNFPVQDYMRNCLLMGPAMGLDNTLMDNDISGILTNPMEHGMASLSSIVQVADYAWNPVAYDALASWQRSAKMLFPAIANDYLVFASNSTDAAYQSWGYHRPESFLEMNPTSAGALDRMIAANQNILASNEYPMLMAEIQPWVEQQLWLAKHARKVLDIDRALVEGDTVKAKRLWQENLMQSADSAAFNAHKSGTKTILPFYTESMDSLSKRMQ